MLGDTILCIINAFNPDLSYTIYNILKDVLLAKEKVQLTWRMYVYKIYIV